MANDSSGLSILLRAKLDSAQESLKSINLEIDKLSKNPALSKLKLKIDIDTKSVEDLLSKINKLQAGFNGSGGGVGGAKPFIDDNLITEKIQRINNSLERLKVNKDKVFADSGVIAEVNRLKEMEIAFKKGEVTAKQYALQMDNVRTKVAQVSGSFQNVNKDGYTFVQMLELAAKKIAIWGLSTQLVYGSFKQLKQGISYISELSNFLNEIQIVTMKTDLEVNKLAKSYNSLAKEMKVTTKEIASESANLYRQGLNDSEVEDRMKGIIQYAKISSISIADSNKIITATANATGQSIQKIIDIFALLGDTTSSGADEIGEALQRVASASENSNLSLEKTSSWLATISSISRESSSTIGRSLNSIISRYESIKAKGFNEEDATKINDVTKALAAIKINPTVNGQLRDLAEVMDEVGSKWDGLTKNEKAYIATTMAG
jgi:TP901 family phage tail tape measure protein